MSTVVAGPDYLSDSGSWQGKRSSMRLTRPQYSRSEFDTAVAMSGRLYHRGRRMRFVRQGKAALLGDATTSGGRS